MSAGRPREGFTLIEVLAGVFLTSIVLTGATAFYIQIADAANAATRISAEGRHAVSILDRIAHDIEGAYLVVKPEAVDPLEHPWLFLGEERLTSDGANRLKFTVHNHQPRHDAGHAGNLAMVTYQLRSADSGGYELVRRVEPGLPAGLDRDFGDADEMSVVAEGLALFGASFLNEEGDWVGVWDSSTLAASSQLPLAAEIRLAMLDRDALEADGFEEPGQTFTRRVVLPVRPIDLDALRQGEELLEDDDLLGDDEDEDSELDGEEGGEAGGMTVGQCIAANRDALLAAGLDPGFLDSFGGFPPDTPVSETGFSSFCQ